MQPDVGNFGVIRHTPERYIVNHSYRSSPATAATNSTAHGLSLLDQITEKRQDANRARAALFHTTVNFFILVGIYFDKSFGNLIWQIHGLHLLAKYVVYMIEVVCALNFVGNGFRYLKFHVRSSVVELTVEQQRLFGVYDDEPGFRILRGAPATRAASTGSPKYSPSNYTGRPSYTHHSSPSLPLSIHNSCCSPQHYSPMGGSTPGRSFLSGPVVAPLSGISPPGYSLNSSSPGVVATPFRCTGLTPHDRSPSAFVANPNLSFPGSLNYSSQATPPGYPLTSGGVPVVSTAFQHDVLADRSGIGSKTSPKLSPLQSEDCIRDQKTLQQYLHEQGEKQSLKAAVELQSSGGGTMATSSFWSFGRTVLDYLPALRHYQYQPAPRNPVSATSCKDDPRDEHSSPAGNETAVAWLRLGVDQDRLDQWVENLRKWLGSTILSRLVVEMDEANALLVRVGSEDIRLGEASLTTLKQICAIKSQQVAQLTALLPYVDLTPNQDYLIQRIRDLAGGGCMSAFKWNGGAEYKGKPWDETLPTDSRILIHLFCAYLDARLPGNLKYPDGKTFTSQHFVLAPDKPNLLKKKENLAIYMTRTNPPHFTVVIEGTICNVKPGRHNLFHAVLLFLYHINVKEHGMLRRINLGMSGLNILWIFDQQS